MPQHQQLLPPIAGRADYEPIQPDIAVWLPAIQTICARHRLASAALTRFNAGSNVVFAAGERHIVKLYPPFERPEFVAERAVAEYVHGKLPVETPEILAAGELEGWPYLVMSRLNGRYLLDIWDQMDRPSQQRIVIALGELAAQLHALPTEGLPQLQGDWPGFIRDRLSGCVERHRAQGVTEEWLWQIPGYLASAQPLYPPDFRPAIVSGDIHQYHLLVVEERGQWRLSGLFDFDDARVGFHEYDLAASGLFIMHGRPELLRAFFRAYGYADAQLDGALRARLMAYTLLHRYRHFNWVREELVEDHSSATFEQFAERTYPFS